MGADMIVQKSSNLAEPKANRARRNKLMQNKKAESSFVRKETSGKENQHALLSDRDLKAICHANLHFICLRMLNAFAHATSHRMC